MTASFQSLKITKCRDPPFNFKILELKGEFIVENNSRCFIKKGKGIYEEITYKELENRRKISKEYRQKKFIYINKMLLEVSEDEYKCYYAEIERSRYSKKILKKLQTVSIEQLNSNDSIENKQVIADNSENIENKIERKLELEQLKNALMKLDDNEYKLVRALFFEEKTVREYANIIGINYGTIQYRKKVILKKLKKMLKI